MKKFITLTAIAAALFVFAGSQLAFAQETVETPAAADVFPDTIDLLYGFHTNTDNPLEDLVAELLNEGFPLFGDSAEIGEIFMRIFADNQFYFGMDVFEGIEQYEQPHMYLAFYLTQEDFDRIMELQTTAPETEVYNDVTIYTTGYDTHFVNLDGLFVVTSTAETAKKLIDNHQAESPATLANYEPYTNSLSYETWYPFLTMYINPSFLVENMAEVYDPVLNSGYNPMFAVDESLLAAIVVEGFSVTETLNGFDFGVYVEGDKAKLEEMDMMFDKYNFSPKLYEYISGNDIIFYTEQYDFTGSLEDSLEVFSEDPEFTAAYDEFNEWFAEQTELDFTEDFLDLLEGRYLVAMHKTEQIMPAVTVIFEVISNKDDAQSMLVKLNTYLKEGWEAEEKEAEKEFYSYQIVTTGGTSFYQHNFDLSVLVEDPAINEFPAEQMQLSLNLGVNSKQQLIISTHTDLGAIFKTENGMLDNPDFAYYFDNAGEEIANIMFMDFKALESYLETVMIAGNATQEEVDFLNGIFTPWYDFYIKTYAKENKTWAFGSIMVDTSTFAEYGDVINELVYGSYEYDDYYYDDIPFPEDLLLMEGITYCDVSEEDWYHYYINELTELAIVSGYDDGCFRPENDVTRAEFVKMVVGAADWNGLYIPVAMSDADIYFEDVPSDTWYWHDVSQAAANGFIDGYEDGTFKPNQPISRAEAIQILYNISPILQGSDTYEPFDDVMDDSWFQTAVGAAYNQDVVSGTSETTFEPARNITRAEAAKIVFEFMYLFDVEEWEPLLDSEDNPGELIEVE
jgi:hypothetical protein